MQPGIFREYDIRGIAGTDFNDDDVFKLGKAMGTYLIGNGSGNVIVGKDCRKTSDTYEKNLIEGLLTTGIDVVKVGLCPTPVLYFSIRHFKSGGGIMVTASHNPKEYNGFKVCLGTDSVHGKELIKIRDIIEQETYRQGNGTLTEEDAITPYTAYLSGNIKLKGSLKVGIDAGNGTGGFVSVPFLKSLGCDVYDIYCDPDGDFPNHPSDPTVASNMKDLSDMVKKKNLDVGIGYDGDADRIGVIDELGNLVYGDQLMIIFSREILSRRPGATFISEVKCSKTMYDDIRDHGGNPIMWKTGHSLIKAKMKEVDAALAGEMSGHMFFADRYLGYDDALYATCRLLEILTHSGKKVTELLEGIPKTFNTPEIRVECADDIKFKVVDKITSLFKQEYDVIDIDGMRVLFDDGWGLVRASNTQPALVLRFEAMSEARLNEIRNLVETKLNEIKKHY